MRPSDTQAQVNARIAEAAASLAQIQKDAQTLSKEEQDKLSILIGLQRLILAALRGNTKGSFSSPGTK